MPLKIVETVFQARAIVYLMLTFLSAGGFFAATSTAFVILPISEFSHVAAMLALSTVIGAVLQFGAAYSLPEAARRNPEVQNRLFFRLLAVSAACGVSATLVANLWTDSHYLVLGIALGGCKGIHIICDNYLRSHTAVLTLGSLNAFLHASFFAIALSLALFGELTGGRFLILMMLTKLCFAVLAILAIPPTSAGSTAGLSSIFRIGVNGSLAVILVFGMGALDVVTLAFKQFDNAQFISFRHFGYGLFLTLVQDCALPLLLSHLILRAKLPMVHIASVAIALAGVVGVMSVALGYGLGMIPQKPAMSVDISALIFASMTSHAFAVVAFNAAYIVGAVRQEFLLTWLLALLSLFAIGAIFSNSIAAPVLISAAGNTVLGLSALLAYARSGEIKNTSRKPTFEERLEDRIPKTANQGD